MIDINLSDLIGGTPMTDTTPVFHVHTPHEGPRKVLEKVAAADADAALQEAKTLIGDVDGLFVTGPHEHVEMKAAAASENKTDKTSDFAERTKDALKK